MWTHLLLATLGAAIFLRIVAKEKNRRQRYLLLRFAEQEKRLAEQGLAAQAETAEAGADDEPVEVMPIGQAA